MYFPNRTPHGLTPRSRNGFAATEPAKRAGLGGNGGHLSATASRQRHAAGPGVFSRQLGDAVCRPAAPQALTATLVSTLIATLGSLFVALTLLALLWPGEGWQRLSTRLPLLLAVPHVAFATSALLLFAEGGSFTGSVQSVRRSLTATVSGLA